MGVKFLQAVVPFWKRDDSPGHASFPLPPPSVTGVAHSLIVTHLLINEGGRVGVCKQVELGNSARFRKSSPTSFARCRSHFCNDESKTALTGLI